MPRPKLLKIFESQADNIAYSKLVTPITVSKSGNSLVSTEVFSDIQDSSLITFEAPCNCADITQISISINSVNTTFLIEDTLGNPITSSAFLAYTRVTLLLDTINNIAYLVNQSGGGSSPSSTMRTWKKAVNSGETSVVLSGEALPSSDTSKYIVTLGAATLDSTDFTLNTATNTVTLTSSHSNPTSINLVLRYF